MKKGEKLIGKKGKQESRKWNVKGRLLKTKNLKSVPKLTKTREWKYPKSKTVPAPAPLASPATSVGRKIELKIPH